MSFTLPDSISLSEGLLCHYYRLVCDTMISYQWDALNDLVDDAEKSYSIENIRIAAGESEGEFHGCLFQDSDTAKWLEAVAYCIKNGDCKEWEQHADEVIALIAKAQQPDGYFNTFFQLKHPDKRFVNLYEAHELYCLGHFIEAAVAYANTTGKTELLGIFKKYADLVDSLFGPQPGKSKGYPGHQEIELALARLFESTSDKKYLDLAKFFLDERGMEPHFFAQEWEKRGGISMWSGRKEPQPKDFSYNQAHKPVREQREAVGHAVRALYMYSAMAEVGRLCDDEGLLNACRALFEDISKQMYVTGSVGSTNHGEAFTFAYDLPNEINYSETCASIALVFFMRSMLKVEPLSQYADVMENALYNTVLASIGTDAKSYFYVNPMEVLPEANEKNPAREHVKARRQKWHHCACCPPNVARLLASIQDYLCSIDKDINTIFFHLYGAVKLKTGLNCGLVDIDVHTSYPDEKDVIIVINEHISATFALRVPGWCDNMEIYHNGKTLDPEIKNGYAYILREFNAKDSIAVRFNLTPRLIRANTQVRSCAGKVCIQRGPLIYCLEECDNGDNLHSLLIDPNTEFTEKADCLCGVLCTTLTAQGFREADFDDAKNSTYTHSPKNRTSCELKFVPYYLWGNREPGEMLVWVREAQGR